MSLTKLIKELKLLADSTDAVGCKYAGVPPSDILKLCQAAEVMHEELALMSEGEGRDYRVYITISKAAIKKADAICAEVEG